MLRPALPLFRGPFLLASALLIGTLAFTPSSADAQLRGLGNRLKRAATDEVGRAAENIVRNGVRCALGDAACAERARRDGKTPVFEDPDGNIIVDDEGNPITDPEDAAATQEDPGTGIWRNYDFVPGSEVIYALDLTNEPIGRIPARQIEFVNGNVQVVEKDGKKVLEFSSETLFYLPLPRELPDDFTVELEFQAAAPNVGLTFSTSRNEGGNRLGWEGHYVSLWQKPGIDAKSQNISSQDGFWHVSQEMVPFKFQVDGDPEYPDYAILYAGTERVAQVPNATFPRTNVIEIRVAANNSRKAYLSDVIVAIHGDPLYDALTNTGSFTTRGILFDVDSDRIRPESTPTLTTIVTTLNSHEDLDLVIEGHTDSSGDDDYNQELSERRAQAVVDYLTEQGIAEGRLSAEGKGESTPVAANSTEAGRQQNRRVVLRTGGS